MSVQTPVVGETKLEKNVTRTFVAGQPGTPGSPGSPGVPAHYILVTEQAPTTVLPFGWTFTAIDTVQGTVFVPTPPTSAYNTGTLVQQGGTYTHKVLVPAVPAVPPQPGKPAIPSQTIINNNIGWNASGRTAFEAAPNGRWDFLALLNMVGAVVGLYQYVTVDYTLLTHAMYLARGLGRIVEQGQLVGPVFTYLDTDTLTISITNGVVRYHKNGLTLYKSLNYSPGFVRLVACEYLAGDGIYDVVSGTSFNEAASRFQPMLGYGLSNGHGNTNNYVPLGRLLTLTGSSVSYPNHASMRTADGTINGGGAIRPITSIGFGFGTGLGRQPNVAENPMHAIGGGGAWLGHTVRGPLLPLTGFSASTKIGYSNGVMKTLTGFSQEGELQPQYGVAEDVMTTLGGSALALLYERANVSSAFPVMIGVSGGGWGHPYDYATTPMKMMIGKSYSYLPGYKSIASFMIGSATINYVHALISGSYTIGHVSSTFVGAIHLPNEIFASLELSSSFHMQPKFLVMMMEALHVSGPISAKLKLIAALQNSLTIESLFTYNQLLYARMMSRLAVFGARSSSLDFTPSGLDSSLGQTWVVNAEQGLQPSGSSTGSNASSRYENFDFNSFAFFEGQYFGARPDGVYLLEGDDDAGEPVRSSVDFGKKKFGTSNKKRMVAAWIGVTSTGKMVMKVSANGEDYFYDARTSDENLSSQRFDFGKGLRANYFDFELYNGRGEDFDLDTIEFFPVTLDRRIG